MAKAKVKETSIPEKSTSAKSSSKKAPEKTVEKKATKPALEKVVVTAKQIGKNLNVVIGKEKFTRIGTKEELTEVKEAVQKYLDTPTKGNLEALMIKVRPETAKKEAAKEEVKAKAKAVKNEIKNSPKDTKKKIVVSEVVKEIDEKMMTSEELDEMEKAIKRQREKIATVAQKSSTVPKGREW